MARTRYCPSTTRTTGGLLFAAHIGRRSRLPCTNCGGATVRNLRGLLLCVDCENEWEAMSDIQRSRLSAPTWTPEDF